MPDMAEQLAKATMTAYETASALADALKDSRVPLAAQKLSKDQTEYRPATEDDKTCGDCRYMNPKAGTCDRVSGRIEADWVCNLFHAKEHG